MNAPELLRSRFISVPELQVENNGAELVISNAAVGTRAAFPPEILDLLDFFATPRPLAEWLARPGACRDALAKAVSHALVSDVNRLLGPSRNPVGRAALPSEFLGEDHAGATVLLGAPIDVASTGRAGARHGPAEIRENFRAPIWGGGGEGAERAGAADPVGRDRVFLDFEMRRQYSAPVPDVLDLGDVAALPGEGIATYGPRVELVADMIVERGGIPAMLGGDHSCTAYAIKPHLKRNKALGIIHFDAHHDLWPPPAPQYSYVTHANALYGALGSDRVSHMRQLGVRVFDAAVPGQLKGDSRLSYFSARELQHMAPPEAFSGLPTDIPYYLSFDIDCIDPQIAPETGTPLPGGLTYYQALDLVDHAARNFDLAGWDIVEVGQRAGGTNGAALCAGRLMRQLMLGKMSHVAITNYARPL